LLNTAGDRPSEDGAIRFDLPKLISKLFAPTACAALANLFVALSAPNIFVDVLLFSFQGSNYNAALIGDLINIPRITRRVNTKRRKTSDSANLFSAIVFGLIAK